MSKKSLVISLWSLARKKPRGFTLIELMVAISIVTIVSAVGLVGYGQAQRYARDAKRKQDVKAIQLAVELYKQVNSTYPATVYNNSSLSPSYIASIPTDPKGGNYTYFTNSSGVCSGGGMTYGTSQFYYVSSTLENTNDAERHAVKAYKSCDGNAASGWNANSYVVSNNQ